MDLFKKGLLALLFLFLAVGVLAVSQVTTSINVLDQMPSVSNLTIFPSNISFGGYVNVSVNATAYHGVSGVLMQIKISNGTTVNYTMINSTNLDVYNYSYFVPLTYPAGVYNITIIANSTYNAVNNSVTGNFTVSSGAVTPVTPAVQEAVRNNRGDLIGRIVSQSEGWYNPAMGSRIAMSITREELIATLVAFTLINDFDGTFRMTVSASKEMSGVSGVAYGFFKIDAPDVTFREGIINFRVSKSWISENNIDKIFLYSYDNGDWNRNDVNFIRDDGDYMHYSVNVNSFGTFAVAGSLFSGEVKKPSEEITYKEIIQKVPRWAGYVALVWAAMLAAVLVLIIYLMVIKKPKIFGEK